METLQVTKIENRLANRQSIVFDDNGTPVDLMPGQVINEVSNFTINLLNSVDEITPEEIRLYEAEGDPTPLGYAIVAGTGLISAVGMDPSDFDLGNPEVIWISLPEAASGQNILIAIEEDTANQTWIIGEIDTGQ